MKHCLSTHIYFILLFPLLLGMLSCRTDGASGEGRPSIVLVIIDTLRADHLSCYGYRRITSPSLDSLAGAGTRWSMGCGQSSWTLPACSSIMTGLSPRVHGAGMDVPTGRVFGLNHAMPLLSTHMKGAGYRTGAFFNVFWLGADFGFHRGFDTYECVDNGDGLAGETIDSAINWLSSLGRDEDFFLAIHLFDPHDPYDPPAPYDTLFTPHGEGAMGDSCWEVTPEGAIARPSQLAHLQGLYDGEIAWTDEQLGRLFAELRRLGLDQRTVVMVTADHGEEFLEHGYFGHGRTLFQETTHIPLIMSGPGVTAGAVEDAPVGQVDILPTILDLCDIAVPENIEGVDLLADPDTARFLPASGINTGDAFDLASITARRMKLIWNAGTDHSSTYDLVHDPGEMDPLPADSVLLGYVLFYWASPCRLEPILLEDWKVVPVLRDLGYIR